MRNLRWLAMAVVVAASGTARAKESVDAGQILSQLRAGNQEEVERAELVAGKASSQAVRQYAQMLADDHRTMVERIDALARQLEVKDTARVEPEDPGEQKIEQALKTMSEGWRSMAGPDLDRNYLGAMVIDHDNDLATLTRLRSSLGASPIAGLVDAELPLVKHHRDRAYQLLGQSAPKLQQARAVHRGRHHRG